MNDLKDSIINFKNDIKDFKEKLYNLYNNIIKNFDIYYKIYNNIINNYDNKNRNYQVYQNMKDINFKNISNNINEIINDKNLSRRLTYLLDIYDSFNKRDEYKNELGLDNLSVDKI